MALGLLAAVLSTLACATPQVGSLPQPPADLSDAQIDERLAFLEERLDANRRHASLWHWGWLGASVGGLALGTYQAVVEDDDGERAAGIATAVLAAGGIAYLELLPVNARHGADPVRALPATTHEERLAKLERAQEILLENADRATVQRDWVTHAANAAVSLAAGGIVYATGSEAGPAVTTTVMALVGGEVQFWTEPYGPRRDLTEYRKRFGLGGAVGRSLRLVPARGGLALQLDF